ncbi:MAG: SprT family zinc-dependent metalloprotease [Longimicrobiales bacterium]|nr:SprT family zinc-dependent metalloprotease [Longimicrobiales bacterium]
MLTPTDFLHALRERGTVHVRCVRFRHNRHTVWSLTQRGTVLNVHAAYRRATPSLLDAFARIAIEGGITSRHSRAAAEEISDWPDLKTALADLRRQHADRTAGSVGGGAAHCCATPDQHAYLRTLYHFFNTTRFDGRLPDNVPVRLSNRMKSALGHMMPGVTKDEERRVTEIALNVDLMLPGNGAERADTLLHEMAHVADYLESGGRGHGASWKAWAQGVGCRPTTLYDRPVRYRKRRRDAVTRVPPLPAALSAQRSALAEAATQA